MIIYILRQLHAVKQFLCACDICFETKYQKIFLQSENFKQ